MVRIRDTSSLEDHIIKCVSQEVYDADIYSKVFQRRY